MRKGSKIEGRLRNVTNWLTNVEKPRYTRKWLCLRLRNFFSKRIFDTRFDIGSVDISEISQHTKSEQPRVAGKHLTRYAENGYAAVAIATLRSRASNFW